MLPAFGAGSFAPLSSEILAALLVAAFAFLPGLGIAYGIGRRAGWDLPATLAASVPIGVGVVAFYAGLAYFAGLPLDFVALTWAIAVVALWVAGFIVARGAGPLVRHWLAFPVSAAFAILALWERQLWARTADTWYHLAAVRSLLATDRPIVTDPFFKLAGHGMDPTSGVWHTFLAIVSKLTHVDVTWLWVGAGPVMAFFMVLAFWVLARALSNSELGAAVATIAYFVLSVYLDFRHYAQPDQLSQGLAFLALAGFVMLAQKPNVFAAFLAIVSGFAASAVHLASAQTVLLSASALVFWLLVMAVYSHVRGRPDWKPLAWTSASLAACAALSLPFILPKAAALLSSSTAATAAVQHVTRVGRFLVFTPGQEIGGGLPLFVVTAAAAVFAGVVAFAQRDRRSIAALAFLGLPVMVLLDPPLTTLLISTSYFAAARIAALMRYTSYAGIAWVCNVPGGRRWKLAGAAWAIALLLAAAVEVPDQLRTTFDPSFFALRKGSPQAVQESRVTDVQDRYGRLELAAVASRIGTAYPVVLSDAVTSHSISGLMPVAVLIVPESHIPFGLSAAEITEREAAVADALDPLADEAKRRLVVDRYDVSYVAVGPLTQRRGPVEKSLLQQQSLFKPVLVTRSLSLFQVIR